MQKTVKRAAGRFSAVAAAAFLAMAFTAAVTPAISHADCEGGQWWDPVANTCQAPVVPNCENGWWDPVANTCRPAIATTPLACDDGWWWDPVGNVCRPPLLPPQ